MLEYITFHALLEAGACERGVAAGMVDIRQWYVPVAAIPANAADWLYGNGDRYGDGKGNGYGNGYGDGNGNGASACVDPLARLESEK